MYPQNQTKHVHAAGYLGQHPYSGARTQCDVKNKHGVQEIHSLLMYLMNEVFDENVLLFKNVFGEKTHSTDKTFNKAIHVATQLLKNTS